MVQAREGLPGALPATDGSSCIRGNPLVLDTGIPSGATAAHNASAASLKSSSFIPAVEDSGTGLKSNLFPNIPFSILGRMLLRY